MSKQNKSSEPETLGYRVRVLSGEKRGRTAWVVDAFERGRDRFVVVGYEERGDVVVGDLDCLPEHAVRRF